ncbi:hypothetical protein HK098_007658 [Nowakowskiella sp. JEL0407]|nr:hypothetical protein HK098_007658 [Nowakowskiella sp. JEL0407]
MLEQPDVSQLQTRIDQALQRASPNASPSEWLAVKAELDHLKSELDNVRASTATPTIEVVAEDDLDGAVNAANADWPLSDDEYLYDFFISASPSESRLAMELYFRLQLHEDSPSSELDEYQPITMPFRKRVFYDTETLSSGEDWRSGINRGLKRSKCIVLLISRSALNGMKNSDTHINNVLLEWEMALLSYQKSKCVLVPVFIGENGNRFDVGELLSPNLPSMRFSPNSDMMQCHFSARTTLAQIANLSNSPNHYLDNTSKESINDCIAHLVSSFNVFSEDKFALDRGVIAAKDILETLKSKTDGTWDSDKFKLKEELSTEDFELFTFVIAKNFTWKHLDLSKQSLRGTQARSLALAMKVNATLETLNLKRNEAGDDGAKMLSDALKSNADIQNHLSDTRPSEPEKRSPTHSPIRKNLDASKVKTGVPVKNGILKKPLQVDTGRKSDIGLARKSMEGLKKSTLDTGRKSMDSVRKADTGRKSLDSRKLSDEKKKSGLKK